MLSKKERFVKESTLLKAIAPLLVADLTWSDLLVRSGLSKDTLSVVLDYLKGTGDVEYSLGKKEGSKRPTIVYSFTKKGKQRYSEILIIMKEISEIEELFQKIALGMRTTVTKDMQSRKKIFKDYYDLAVKASLAVMETALQWEPKGTSLDDAVANEAVSTARRILLLQDLPAEISQGIREDLLQDKNSLMRALRIKEYKLKDSRA